MRLDVLQSGDLQLNLTLCQVKRRMSQSYCCVCCVKVGITVRGRKLTQLLRPLDWVGPAIPESVAKVKCEGVSMVLVANR